MKHIFRGTLRSKAFFRMLALLSLSVYGSERARCQVSSASNPILKTAKGAAPKGTEPAASQSVSLSCPPAGPSLAQESQTRPGHHKVTLAWIAASSSARPGGDVVGYCLYRSKTQYVAKQNPLCPICERVNSVPVQGVSCVDDSPDDNTIYYYVVTSINGAQSLSSTSNEASAPIPPGDQPGSNPLSSPRPPSCRGESAN